MNIKEACYNVKDSIPTILQQFKDSLALKAVSSTECIIGIRAQYKLLGEIEQLILNETEDDEEDSVE